MLAKNIKKARIDAELTQTKLAQKIGVAHATIGHYETGRSTPSKAVLAELAKALYVTPQHLTGGSMSVIDARPESNDEGHHNAQGEQGATTLLQISKNNSDSVRMLSETNKELAEHIIELGRALLKKQ
jgi:transcriptional regulator with XRE-family HTH domain